MIYIGADHGGYKLKEKMKDWLDDWGQKYVDLGAESLDPEDDYTKYAKAVAEKVDEENVRKNPWEEQAKGILLCRSGGGMLIAANRFANVRGVYVFNGESAKHARADNDCNLISLAADWVEEEDAHEALKVWLMTPFSGEERHERRVSKLAEISNN